MADNNPAADPAATASEGVVAETEPAKSKLDLGKVLVILVVLGFFAENAMLMAVYKPWAYGMPAAVVAEPTPTPTPDPNMRPAGPQSVISLDPFLVNLARPDAHRYAKVRLQLGFADPDAPEQIANSDLLMAPARQLVIDLIGSRKADDVTSVEGKSALREELQEELEELPWPSRLTDVFITEFLVQF